MINIGIVGISGLLGQELLNTLLRHRYVKIVYLGGRKIGNIQDILFNFKKKIECSIREIDVKVIENQGVEVCFFALPHGEGFELAQELLKKGIKVIDLSGNFRLKDPSLYEVFYKFKHPCTNLLKLAVYGLCELQRENIKNAKLIANPGCFPTSIILPLIPLIEGDLIEEKIIVKSFSGITGVGSGYSPNKDNLFIRCNENLRGYSFYSHQHIPEIEEFLYFFSKKYFKVTFFPFLIPIQRGIYTIIHTKLKRQVKESDLIEIFRKYSDKHYFIRFFENPQNIEIRNTTFTNFLDFSFVKKEDDLFIFSCLDNLGKGGAHQAVQNLNILCGFDEKESLQ